MSNREEDMPSLPDYFSLKQKGDDTANDTIPLYATPPDQTRRGSRSISTALSSPNAAIPGPPPPPQMIGPASADEDEVDVWIHPPGEQFPVKFVTVSVPKGSTVEQVRLQMIQKTEYTDADIDTRFHFLIRGKPVHSGMLDLVQTPTKFDAHKFPVMIALGPPTAGNGVASAPPSPQPTNTPIVRPPPPPLAAISPKTSSRAGPPTAQTPPVVPPPLVPTQAPPQAPSLQQQNSLSSISSSSHSSANAASRPKSPTVTVSKPIGSPPAAAASAFPSVAARPTLSQYATVRRKTSALPQREAVDEKTRTHRLKIDEDRKRARSTDQRAEREALRERIFAEASEMTFDEGGQPAQRLYRPARLANSRAKQMTQNDGNTNNGHLKIIPKSKNYLARKGSPVTLRKRNQRNNDGEDLLRHRSKNLFQGGV